LDNFDDRYLGAKTSDPSLDNDGNALAIGALYFNTTDGVMKVYTASGWIAASSASVATLATFEFVATAGQTVFTGNDANGSSLSYVAPALIVTLNGVRLRPGDDYTATNGTSITLASAAALNDELVVDAFGSFLVANTYTIAQADSLLAAKISNTGSQSISGNLTVTNSSGSTIVANRTSNPGSIELQFGGTQTAQLSAVSGGGLAFYRGSTPTLAMQYDSAGRVTMPSQPRFDASATANGSGSGEWGSAWSWNINVNVGSHFNANGRFTAPVAGTYLFYIEANSPTTGAVIRARVRKNGSDLYAFSGGGARQIRGDNNAESIWGIWMIELSAGDYVSGYSEQPASRESAYSAIGGYLLG
jgi:hypothetical protein